MSPFRYGEPSETCPSCDQVLDVRDTRWVKKDESTWQLVKEAACPGCGLTGVVVLRTFHQTR